MKYIGLDFFKNKYFGLKNRCHNLIYYRFFNRFDITFVGSIIIRGYKGNHQFNKGLKIFPNCIFEVFSDDSNLTIGSNCYISYGTILACSKSIKIGDNVWIGEYCSIRDSTHDFSINNPLGSNLDICDSVKIGNNVWIGRGTLILPGTIIGDNVIIAANSVVKGVIENCSLYGGSPVRFIKYLNQ